jgi:hypothetical protein
VRIASASGAEEVGGDTIGFVSNVSGVADIEHAFSTIHEQGGSMDTRSKHRDDPLHINSMEAHHFIFLSV